MADESRQALKRPTGKMLVLLVIISIINIFLWSQVSRFEQIFADMLGNKPLPAITQFVIACSQSWLPLILSVLLPLGPIVIYFKIGSKKAWKATIYVFVFLIIETAFVTWALFLPMQIITDGMSKS